MAETEYNKEQLKKGIKKEKIRLGITKGIIYLNGACAIWMTGDSIYRLTEGDYKLALFEAGLAIFNGYIAYDFNKFRKVRQERLKNKQSELESIVEKE